LHVTHHRLCNPRVAGYINTRAVHKRAPRHSRSERQYSSLGVTGLDTRVSGTSSRNTKKNPRLRAGGIILNA
jgi:hypothetical protein